jgi:hypothetical protein
VIGIIALSLVLAGLIGSMAAAPTVIRRVYKTNFLGSSARSATSSTSACARTSCR